MGKWAKYERKYSKSWEKDPDLKVWIRPVANQQDKAFCLFCRKNLRAHHSDLIQHVKTGKHQSNETKFENLVFAENPDVRMVLASENHDYESHPEVVVSFIEEDETSEIIEPANVVKLIQFGILTVSDSLWKGERLDESGEYLQNIINSGTLPFNGVIFVRQCAPDNSNSIQSILTDWADLMQVDVILTTGGTGFTARDVTPEATRAVVDKLAPGISVAMTMESLKHTQMGMLSRAVAGIRNKTLIVNLPGSKKGVQECFEAITPIIQHAVDQIKGCFADVAVVHKELALTCTETSEASTSQASNQHGNLDIEDFETESSKDSLSVSRRPRNSPYPVVAVDYAVKLILKESYVVGIEMPNLFDCLGCYLVHDVVSNVNLPPFPASIKDGYAVIADDGAGKRRVKGAMSAGAQPDSMEVEPGTCVRISTGAPIPKGANAVVQVEDTQLVRESDFGGEELEINILKAPKIHQDVRPVGFDLTSGQTVLERHIRLGPTELALLASIGKGNPSVFKRPRVAVLSTGSELQTPGQFLKPGCIWDSNKYGLMALLEQNGFSAKDLGIARDTIDSVKDRLRAAMQDSSVVITTGGVSMGEKDLIKYVLIQHFKAKIHFGQIFMKPGKPSTFATCTFENEKKMIFALPGNPVSALVTFQLLVFPALRSMSGDLDPKPKIIKVALGHKVILDPRPEYQRVIIEYPNDGVGYPVARNTGNQLSSRLASMFKANALLVLPPKSIEVLILEQASIVDAILLNFPF